MELTQLNVAARALGNSRESKRLRASGKVPAVYYGPGQEPVTLLVDAIALRPVFVPGKRYTLLDLVIDGKGGNPAVIYEYQKDAINGEILHIDFLRISAETPVKVRVPVILDGLPVGVKNEGGMLSQENRYIYLNALPGKIPTSFKLDVSDVHAGTTFYAKDLKLEEGVKLASQPRVVLFMVTKGKGKEEEAAEAAATAAAKPAAAAPAKVEAKPADKGKK